MGVDVRKSKSRKTISATNAELGYIAGFVDGEGCIYIGRYKRSTTGQFYHSLDVTTSQTNPAPLLFMKNIFGGSIDVERPSKNTFGKRNLYRHRISYKKAGTMLEHLLPFLIVKKEEAELALEFLREVSISKKTIPISEERYNYRETLRMGISSLKKRIY